MRYFLMSKKIFKNLNMHAIVLLASLCKYSNGNDECFPSRKTISNDCGFSVSTYNKYILTLMQQGIITKTPRQRSNGSQTSNLFKINNRRRKECFSVRSDIFSRGLSVKSICVYICLSKYIAEDKCCRVSQGVIARDCGLSTVSVIKAVHELKKAGLLDAIRQTNISNNGNFALLYCLDVTRKKINVIRRRLDVKSIFQNKEPDTVKTGLFQVAVMKKMATFLSAPVNITHPLYKQYTPPELYLF